MREWIAVLSANIEVAIRAGDLRGDVHPAAMAFRLNALGMAANRQRQLLDDPAGGASHDVLDGLDAAPQQLSQGLDLALR
jgi:Tetracyclin repressor-like, C-terminal domain